jgi:Zn-dependent protease
MFDSNFLQRAIIAAPAIFLALTVHEFFHAWTAYRFGDSTARDMGRLTLNPLAHLDLLGVLMMFLSQFHFGWAKPVPVNPYNFRKPRIADIWVSAAGPLSNLGLGLFFGLIFRIVVAGRLDIPDAVGTFLLISVMINVSLAFFNLIPLFPLDGSHILRNLLPSHMGPSLDRFDSISPMLLMGLIMIGAFTTISPIFVILNPFTRFFTQLFLGVPLG